MLRRPPRHLRRGADRRGRRPSLAGGHHPDRLHRGPPARPPEGVPERLERRELVCARRGARLLSSDGRRSDVPGMAAKSDELSRCFCHLAPTDRRDRRGAKTNMTRWFRCPDEATVPSVSPDRAVPLGASGAVPVRPRRARVSGGVSGRQGAGGATVADRRRRRVGGGGGRRAVASCCAVCREGGSDVAGTGGI